MGFTRQLPYKYVHGLSLEFFFRENRWQNFLHRGLSCMEPSSKKLRPYQVRLVTDVCRATEDVLVEQPTGSGKTVQIVTLVAMHLGQRFSHAVISAPQEQIEQGFVKRDYQLISFPDCRGAAVPSIQVPKSLIKGARESRLGSVKRVIHYLRQPGPLDHAFACTHAALNRLTGEDLPEEARLFSLTRPTMPRPMACRRS